MKILIALTAVNLVVSGTTLAVVLVGARKIKKDVDGVKAQSKTIKQKIVTALAELEI